MDQKRKFMQQSFLQKTYVLYKRNLKIMALKRFEKNSKYYTKLPYHYVEHLNFLYICS
jgi:hypothetical protein